MLGYLPRQSLAPFLKMLLVHPSRLTAPTHPRKTGYSEELPYFSAPTLLKLIIAVGLETHSACARLNDWVPPRR